VAFANLIPEYQHNEASIDLMRHRQDIGLEGVMDYLLVSLLQHCKARHWFRLMG
jgi:phosphatidylglycerol lysyltransferase